MAAANVDISLGGWNISKVIHRSNQKVKDAGHDFPIFLSHWNSDGSWGELLGKRTNLPAGGEMFVESIIW